MYRYRFAFLPLGMFSLNLLFLIPLWAGPDSQITGYPEWMKKPNTEFSPKIEYSLVQKIPQKSSSAKTNAVLSKPAPVLIPAYLILHPDFPIDDSEACRAFNHILETLGVKIHQWVTGAKSIYASIPADSLNALAERSEIQSIRQPATPDRIPIDADRLKRQLKPASWQYDRAGLELTEGVNVIGLTSAVNQTGSGIKVGVISTGILGWQEPHSTDDLPASFDISHASGFDKGAQTIISTAEYEGTAIMEIVHDIAPDAEIFLASPYTDADCINAIDWLANTKDVDLIVSDISYGVEALHAAGSMPFQGQSELSKHVSNLVAGGIPFIISSGNFGRSHYQGVMNLDANRIHQYPDGSHVLSLWVEKDASFVVELSWNEPYGRATNDYELVVYTGAPDPILAVADLAAAKVEGYSTSIQNGAGNPCERVPSIINNYAATTEYQIVIYGAEGRRPANLDFEISVINISPENHILEDPDPNSSIRIPADCPAAIVVGAVTSTTMSTGNPRDWYVAEYSSRGPSNAGTRRPVLCAPAGVTTFIGANFDPAYAPFHGTSAAAPHVAGVAALMLEAAPRLSTTEMKKALKNSARSTGRYGAVPNSAEGHGIVYIPDALTQATALQGTIAQREYNFPAVAIAGNFETLTTGGDTGMPAAVGSLTVNNDIRIEPTDDSDPLVIDESAQVLRGTGEIYQSNVSGEGDVKIYSGRFSMNGNGELSEIDTSSSVSIANATFTIGGLSIAQPDIDGDGTREVGIEVTNAVAEIGGLSLHISSFVLSTAGMSIESATMQAPAANMEFSLTNGRLQQNQIEAEAFAGSFGERGTISFNNLVFHTNGRGLAFDSGQIAAFDIGLTLYEGTIGDDGGISISGAEVTGLDSVGLENFVLPSFSIQEGVITIDADLSLSIVGLDAILYGGLTFGGGSGFHIPGYAEISLLDRVSLQIGGLSIASGSFQAATGAISIPSLFDFDFENISFGTGGFSIPSANLEFDIPGLPTDPLIVEDFTLAREPFSITMTPPVLTLGGIEFSVDSITLGQNESGAPHLSLETASFSSETFDILLTSVLFEAGGIRIEGGGSISIADLGTFSLTNPQFGKDSFSADAARFTLLPEFDADGSFLNLDFDFLTVDAGRGILSFDRGDITIARIVNASFGETNIEKGDILIRNAQIGIGNIDDIASVETLAIGPGEVNIDNGSMSIAGFHFDFSMDLVRGKSVELDVMMRFPSDKLNWPDVGGSIGLIQEDGITKVVSFTLSIQGGTIPGTDLGLNNLYVSYDANGSPSGGPQFEGAGEFAIPNYFTVGMSATLFDNCLNSFKVGVYGLNLALGNSGVFFQDIAFGASGFCKSFNYPCTETIYETAWDAEVDCETHKLYTAISYLDDSSILDIVTCADGTEGYLLPVNVSFRADSPPVIGKTIRRAQDVLPQWAVNSPFSTTCEDYEYYRTTEVEVEVPGCEIVITFELEIALTAGPQVDGVALARVDASGKFDTTGWLLIKGDLTILTFPVAGAEFELNPSGPDSGVRLAMYVNLLDVLKGNAEVKIDSSKNVSGKVDASLTIPDSIPIVGGKKLGSVEGSFGNRKISGSATIHIIKDIHFGFAFQNGKVSFETKTDGRQPQSALAGRLFNQGYSYEPPDEQDVRFLTNWNRIGGNVPTAGGNRTIQPLAFSNPHTFRLDRTEDSLIVVVQSSTGIPDLELTSPIGIAYSTDTASDPNVTLLDMSLASEDITSASRNTAFVTIQEATYDADETYIPSAVSFLLIDPPMGNYTVNVKNLSALGEVSVEELVPNRAPSIALATTTVYSPDKIVVEYNAFDPDDEAEIEIFLDNDYDGADGILVATAVEMDGRGSVSFNPQSLPANNADDPVIQSATDWDGDGIVTVGDYAAAFAAGVVLDSHERPSTLSVPSGRYYIVARISDDSNSPISVYGQPLTITNPNAPGKPSNVAIRPASGGLVVTWNGVTDPNRDLVGYKVLYSDDLNGTRFGHSVGVDLRNEDWTSIPSTHSVFLPGLLNGRPYRVAVVAFDRQRNDGEMSDVVIAAPFDGNGFNAPHFTSKPLRHLRAGSLYKYVPTVRDLDGGPLTFTLLHGLAGMVMESTSGVLTFTPTIDHVGSATVEIMVEDYTGLFDTQEFLLQIAAPLEGYPPQWICSRPDYTTYVNELYEYQVKVCQDVRFNQFVKDWESIQYRYFIFRLIEAPAGMTITPNGKIEWRPDYADIGSHRVIVESLETGSGASRPPQRDVQSFHLIVQPLRAKSRDAGPATRDYHHPTPTLTPTPEYVIHPITWTPRLPTILPADTPTPTSTPWPFMTLRPTFDFNTPTSTPTRTPWPIFTIHPTFLMGTPTPTPTRRFLVAPIVKGIFTNNQDGVSGMGKARQIEFSPDGQFAFVLGGEDNAFSTFRVDEENQSVQFTGSYRESNTLPSPRRSVIHPYASMAFIETGDGLVHAVRFDPSTGKMKHLSKQAIGWPGQKTIPGEMAISPGGDFLYIAVERENRILLNRINPDTGDLSLVKMFTLDLPNPAEFTPIQRMLFSPEGDFLYVLIPNAKVVLAFHVNPFSGNLVTRQRLILPDSTFADMKIDPQGRRLLLIAGEDSEKSGAGVFAILGRNPDTGTLTLEARITEAVLGKSAALAIDPSFNRFYSATPNGVILFDIGDRGELLRSEFFPREVIGTGIGEICALGITKNGRFLLVASSGDETHPASLAILELDRENPFATPTPIAPIPTPTPSMGDTPVGILPSPIHIYRFDEPSLSEAGFQEIPGGFPAGTAPGKASIGNIPLVLNSQITDGRGMRITCDPGEVQLLLANPSLPVGNFPVIIRMNARADATQGVLALAALDGGLQGSIASLEPRQSDFLLNQYKRMSLLFRPTDNSGLSVVVQLSVHKNAPGPVSVAIDNIEVIPLVPGTAIESRFLASGAVGLPDIAPPPGIPAPPRFFQVSFDTDTIQQAGFLEIPGGFVADTPAGKAEIGTIPMEGNGKATDGHGLHLVCNPGEVQLLLLEKPLQVGKKPVLIRLFAKAAQPGGKFTVGLLDGKLDGSIAAFSPFDLGPWINGYRRIGAIYEPTVTDTVVAALQLAAPKESEKPAEIYIDNLEIVPLEEGTRIVPEILP